MLVVLPNAWYIADPGTLAQERWRVFQWKRPEKETTPCWWLVLRTKIILLIGIEVGRCSLSLSLPPYLFTYDILGPVYVNVCEHLDTWTRVFIWRKLLVALINQR